MKLQKLMARAALLLGLSLATSAIAGNHADYVGAGPFKTGPEVTKKCMECHEAETKSFMKSVH
jgi:cytochrome c2